MYGHLRGRLVCFLLEPLLSARAPCACVGVLSIRIGRLSGTSPRTVVSHSSERLSHPVRCGPSRIRVVFLPTTQSRSSSAASLHEYRDSATKMLELVARIHGNIFKLTDAYTLATLSLTDGKHAFLLTNGSHGRKHKSGSSHSLSASRKNPCRVTFFFPLHTVAVVYSGKVGLGWMPTRASGSATT